MSTTTKQDNLIDWLRDAHAMEQQAEKMLTAQAERLEHYPVLKKGLNSTSRKRGASRRKSRRASRVWTAALRQ